MALQIPSVDDRNYEDLRKELVERIPVLSETWTDHNPSDPGIMILELLCWLGEMIIYRMDQIPDEVDTNFLKMVIDRPEPVTVELEFTRKNYEVSVDLEQLPPEVAFPDLLKDRIRYDIEDKNLIFIGIMTNEEMESLLEQSEDETFRKAVKSLHKESNASLLIPAGTRVTTTEVSAGLEQLPPEVAFPDLLKDRIRYDVEDKKLIFIGIMTNEEMESLLEQSEDESFRKAVKSLHQESIRSLLNRREDIEISAELEQLPPEVELINKLKDKVRYNAENKRLICQEFLSKEEKDVLLELSEDESFRNAVEILFQKSNSIREIEFETVREAEIGKGKSDVRVIARHRCQIQNEFLGIASGKPNQSFALKEKPVLLDPERKDPKLYNPNPKVRVDGEQWEYRPDLLEAGREDKVFTVEWLTYRVQFGNGLRGQIPKAGDEADNKVICESYQVVLGPEVRVRAEKLTRLLPEEGGAQLDKKVEVTNPYDAAGGRYLFDLSKAKTEGLKAMREPARAIAKRDFEYMATTVFNELDIFAEVKVARAHARRLDDVGTMAIIIIPDPKDPSDRTPKSSAALKRKVYRFLDKRRLITTRIQVGDPLYRPVSIKMKIKSRRHVDTRTLSAHILTTVNNYFHPLKGGANGKGWPLGRSVYRSEIFHLLENIPEVDFVSNIILDRDPRNDSVELKPLELPDVLIRGDDVEWESKES